MLVLVGCRMIVIGGYVVIAGELLMMLMLIQGSCIVAERQAVC